MNAFDFTARQFRNATLAESILAGETPLADYPIYTRLQWESEAQGALDTGDDTELLAMVAEQEEADREEEQARRNAYWGRSPARRSWWNA